MPMTSAEVYGTLQMLYLVFGLLFALLIVLRRYEKGSI